MTRSLCLAFATTCLLTSPARAWSIGSQLDYTGCHEPITTAALRATRAMFDTAPPIAPTRDEAALIDEVQFVPPADFVHDLAAMSLLLGVRDNDLKGNNPLDSLQLVEVHGNPDTQDEHCIRSASDDGEPGNASALAACRAFIHTRVAEALAGLGADGVVDATARMPLAVYVSFAGRVHPELPLFYVKIGQAVHALEDGFTHVYRTPDGIGVTVVTNWIDYVSNQGAKPDRDGPPHLAALDHCEGPDPLVARNYHLAITAATALLEIALDPGRSADDKLAAVDALTAQYLTYRPGCTPDNDYCDAPEPKVADPSLTGCSATGRDASLAIALVIALSCLRRRRSPGPLAALLLATSAHAQPAPAVPVTPEKPGDVVDAETGHEPGRDVKTPTVTQIAQVREDKRLGSPFGFAASVGGSVVHGAGAAALAGRYRLSERWLVGIDGEWNPWVTTAPLMMKAGAASVYATVIRRFPMKFDRVNLRTSLHLGASMLLFDVYGAPKYDIGPFAALCPLGIDYDLGHSMRIVLDPIEIAVPVPHVGLIPLYYEQFRIMVGLQFGA